MATLLPKLRVHFAEFLNKSYLARLSILYLSTCVGLRYGHLYIPLQLFLAAEDQGLRYYFSLVIVSQDYEVWSFLHFSLLT